MLEVRNISVSYGKHEALHQVSLQVRPGELVVMLGANGAGKSSLLKALGGMVTPQAGASAQLAGQELMQLPQHAIVQAGLALVPEGRGVFGDLSVKENLLLGAQPRRARANEASNLEQVFALFPKLRDRLAQTVRTMSGGEQQMVAVGRALMSQPDILLLDEPSLGLAPLIVKGIFEAIKKLNQEEGLTVFLVEQNAFAALKLSDRAYVMVNGKVTMSGSGKELLADPQVRAAYLEGGRH